ncbi:hypothetical protein JKP88DRAFT_322007 [Tribonema minus]|uniref:Uncharacterized protein n=1 Tax=Tribonema minus TaxID=303371 RepID=A0A836CD95_9STRA|nr:hypothetical protein JKP88DRAFT_322007 [Tribonema minus]
MPGQLRKRGLSCSSTSSATSFSSSQAGTCCTTEDEGLGLLERLASTTFDLSLAQWQLALSQVCQRYDQRPVSSASDRRSPGSKNGDGFELMAASSAREACLREEMKHLQEYLGRQVGGHARVNKALHDSLQAKKQLEADLQAATAAYSCKTQELQAALDKALAAQLALQQELQATASRLAIKEAALGEAQQMQHTLSSQLAAHVTDLAASEAAVHRLEEQLHAAEIAAQDQLAAANNANNASAAALRELRAKYERAKARIADAARKADDGRRERDALLRERTRLEAQLADVESFITTDGGQLAKRLEGELAGLKLQLAEVEAERDELEVQLGTSARVAKP